MKIKNYFWLLTLFILVGCSNTTKRLNLKNSPPIIHKLIDSGQTNVERGKYNKIVTSQSDSLFSPGEKTIIKGNGFLNSNVILDGQPIASNIISSDYIEIKLPAWLLPFKQHTLEVINSFGKDATTFNSSHYLIGADTDGNQIHFIRTNIETKQGFDKKTLSLNQKSPLFNLLSKDKNYLFSIGIDNKKESKQNANSKNKNFTYTVGINSVNLSHKNIPKSVNHFQVVLNSKPKALALDDKNTLVILGENDIAFIDVSNPIRPALLNRQQILLTDKKDRTVFVDIGYLTQSNQLVLLEAFSNTLYWYDIDSSSKINLIKTYSIFKNKGLPFTVDLEVDKNNADKLWVLTGNNYRLLGKDIYNEFLGETKEYQLEPQLLSITLKDNDIFIDKSISLPDHFIPFFVKHINSNELVVSGINGEYFNYSKNDDWIDVLKETASMVVNGVQLGRILKIQITSGKVESTIKGVGIYYDLTYIPGKGVAFSLLKLRGTIWAPFVKLAWGMGIENRGTFAIRALSTKALFPPYSLGEISFQ
ncbi:MAG: hypothetical protein COB38_07510 [Gammaproteobacteria bacterium]|nr:MAG: hypothetical protein COB38_07510 [Gammaproteobacteria bacterium]